jgi:hypothetical protein
MNVGDPTRGCRERCKLICRVALPVSGGKGVVAAKRDAERRRRSAVGAGRRKLPANARLQVDGVAGWQGGCLVVVRCGAVRCRRRSLSKRGEVVGDGCRERRRCGASEGRKRKQAWLWNGLPSHAPPHPKFQIKAGAQTRAFERQRVLADRSATVPPRRSPPSRADSAAPPPPATKRCACGLGRRKQSRFRHRMAGLPLSLHRQQHSSKKKARSQPNTQHSHTNHHQPPSSIRGYLSTSQQRKGNRFKHHRRTTESVPASPYSSGIVWLPDLCRHG